MAQTPCTYRQLGDTIDYTPGSAVLAGTVYVIGTTIVTIVPKDIAADEKGAAATRGVFNVPKDNSDVSAGDALYWDADGSPVDGTALSGAFTKTASGNVFAGIALEAAGTGVGDCDMYLRSIDGTVPGNLAPVPAGTVAASNSAINNGTPITALGITLVTAADNTKAVVLPDAAIGSVLWLSNFAGANATLAVFPTVGDAINLLGANNVYTQATNSTVGFVKYNASQWYTF
jgi:predicted RecA/RadA family phage recombinase